ncbi:membrane-associated tyrosine- and threonine-specific cdc2-inhibitory kinase-like [Littorina saxatilis]|uniref:Membrane-associated tyrosine- and threonine-specific cdc2-inhibitory kinase n=1 Tax=Littorina saxatilis TaxID=31220 RepID=A0AAN9B3W3_9CAEN
MEADDETEMFASPRPTPQFYHDQQTFSTKKAKLALGLTIGTPIDCAPPRPPVKSAPPVSRIFPRRRVVGPQPVSFRKAHSLESPFYNPRTKKTYFHQCFDVLERIGQGSFGEVFRVLSKADKQLYAVKRSHEKFRSDSDRRRKLEEVAKYEMLPEHRNLVKFYCAWEEEGKLYIQMELCQYSLNQYALRHHNIPEMTIWCFLIDLLFAVKHLHDHNLVHMDIKPENIFITSQHYCKLGDFGLILDLNKTQEDLSESPEGDAKYLAPELMKGHFGKPADVFSLGLTIMELAGDLDLPRGGEGWHRLRESQLPVEFISTRSTTLKSVISQMLEPDYTKRPTIDQLLAMSSMRKYLKSRLHHYQRITMTMGRGPSQASLAKMQSRANTSTLEEERANGGDMCDSDEDMEEDNMGIPFDDSRADDEVDGMILAPLPNRQVMTEPVIRHHAFIHSPRCSSPAMSRRKLAPCNGSPASEIMTDGSFDSDKPHTPPRPRVLFPDTDITDEDTSAKIEPKNLMTMFNLADDDDISL